MADLEPSPDINLELLTDRFLNQTKDAAIVCSDSGGCVQRLMSRYTESCFNELTRILSLKAAGHARMVILRIQLQVMPAAECMT